MPFQVTRFAITLFLASTALLLSNVGANRLISSTRECLACLQSGQNVCRSAYDIQDGFCCDSDDESCSSRLDNINSVNYEICSKEVLRRSVRPLLCPLDFQMCNICDSNDANSSGRNGCHAKESYVLDPETTPSSIISVSSSTFVGGEVCFFKVSADQEAIESNKLNYQIEMEVNYLRGVTVGVYNGTSLFTASEEELAVEGSKKTYSANKGQLLWLRFVTDASYDKQPNFLISVILKSISKTEAELNWIREFGQPAIDTQIVESIDGESSATSSAEQLEVSVSSDGSKSRTAPVFRISNDGENEGESVIDELSQELTLNEQVVIGALATGFALFILKQRLCPKSWEPRPYTYNKLSPSNGMMRGSMVRSPDQDTFEEGDQDDSQQQFFDIQDISGDKINDLATEISRLDHLWPQKSIKYGEQGATEDFLLQSMSQSLEIEDLQIISSCVSSRSKVDQNSYQSQEEQEQEDDDQIEFERKEAVRVSDLHHANRIRIIKLKIEIEEKRQRLADLTKAKKTIFREHTFGVKALSPGKPQAMLVEFPQVDLTSIDILSVDSGGSEIF